MRLSNVEFMAMNHPLRRFVQKHLEFRNFQSLGLVDKYRNILEIGCGSGYGAVLLSALQPKTYLGIDLMPEQIALAGKWHLPGFEFKTMDAAEMKDIPSQSKEIIVIFGILHHIPDWRNVIGECRRVLAGGGRLFAEEPDGNIVRRFDKLFHWRHPEADFSLEAFEREIRHCGFDIVRKRKLAGFGTYAALLTQ
ncbi:MAG: methyltransferase domain-containing protein [Deltaproteobacteria bacterium]|nr:methyltransferase domain-containing protein [Syntrophaceae bacterium]NLX52712.1 methyltransferase domain-containing protein [Deltaproteobacteria bacterium]